MCLLVVVVGGGGGGVVVVVVGVVVVVVGGGGGGDGGLVRARAVVEYSRGRDCLRHAVEAKECRAQLCELDRSAF